MSLPLSWEPCGPGPLPPEADGVARGDDAEPDRFWRARVAGGHLYAFGDMCCDPWSMRTFFVAQKLVFVPDA